MEKEPKTKQQEEQQKPPVGTFMITITEAKKPLAVKDMEYPDHAEAPFGQYASWVKHLDGVDQKLVLAMEEVQAIAQSARKSEGDANNRWNHRMELGFPKPYLRPYDWGARGLWVKAFRRMQQIEEQVAGRWSGEQILQAKEASIAALEKEYAKWRKATYPRKNGQAQAPKK